PLCMDSNRVTAPRTNGTLARRLLHAASQGCSRTTICPPLRRIATAKHLGERIITPSSTAWPPTLVLVSDIATSVQSIIAGPGRYSARPAVRTGWRVGPGSLREKEKAAEILNFPWLCEPRSVHVLDPPQRSCGGCTAYPF